MRFKSLKIQNFRAITNLELSDLNDVVFIAGPNGCGKSCIFDAIRLLKSAYGGYQPNEWQQWMSEFQINFNSNQQELAGLFQNPLKPIHIFAEITLAEDEMQWFKDNAARLLKDAAWRIVAPELASYRRVDTASFAAQIRAHEPAVTLRVKADLPSLIREIEIGIFKGEIIISPNGEINAQGSRALELIFSQYNPDHIGIIDYHGPQRNYSREQIGGINLNIESKEQQLSQHALYNYANKYTNVKTELASSYVRGLLAREAGNKQNNDIDLNETLKELFATFFPGKEFLGPQPTTDGRLLFNVRTNYGAIHDINELSSGEKEVLYGYLRLRNAAPNNSVLLIDEPELHLNPRLTQGLPQFYHRHLGKALNNQLWLVTHSDTLLRQAVGNDNFKVFHMQAAGTIEPADNQLKEIKASEEVERAVIDLVGDLAAYRPGAKLVVIEGGGDAEFDLYMISQLFPDFQSQVNLISSGNKQRVRELHSLLDKAKESGAMALDVYSITDKDFENSEIIEEEIPGNVLTWDSFHIENYLLEPAYILKVIKDLNIADSKKWDENHIEKTLKECAEQTLPSLVRFHLEEYANKNLVGSIKTNIDRTSSSITELLKTVIDESAKKVKQVADKTLTIEFLNKLEQEHTSKLQKDLSNNAWKKTFRGRDILKRFTSEIVGQKTKYEAFRDLIIARMRDSEHRPAGMNKVIQLILNTDQESIKRG